MPSARPCARASGRCSPPTWRRESKIIIARDRPVLRRGAVRQIEHHLVDKTPAPALGRIIPLDDRVSGGVEMFCGVAVRRVVAAADMPAGPAQAQVNPGRPDLETFLAAACAR